MTARGPTGRVCAGSGLAALAILVVGLLAGCTPESRILHGKWQARGGGATPILPGAVELVLGHYGGDVVGVVRFYALEMDQDAVWGDLTVPRSAACPCAYIAHGRYDEGPRRLTFTVSVTEECPPLAEGAPGPSAPAMVFTLELQSDDELAGSVQFQGNKEAAQPLQFLRNTADSGTILDSDPDKRCEAAE